MKLTVGKSFLVSCIALACIMHPSTAPCADDGKNSCVDCHSNPKFLVQDKKLYDYFQNWKESVHFREGVKCQECHGGNPKKSKKNEAHGSSATRGALDPKSAISSKNIPNTCKKCHEEIYKAYETSAHADKLQEKDGEAPNCVTCHGSLNVSVLKVDTVKATCEKCHNEEKDNSPEIPGEAEELLKKYLVDRRLYKWVAAHDPSTSKESTKNDLGKRIDKLSTLWHTFDLDDIRDTVKQLRTDIKNTHIAPEEQVKSESKEK